MSQEFGRWLQREMDRGGFILVSLARELGMAHTSVRAWLHGKSEPSPEHCEDLAQVLRVPIDDVYRALGRLRAEPTEPEQVRRIRAMLDDVSVNQLDGVEAYLDALLQRAKNRRSHPSS